MKLDLNCRDTICAPSTPQGRSALCIIRVSGPDALAVKETIFKPRRSEQQPFVATLGDIVDAEHTLDEAVCVYFPDTRSFTGEPSFELSLHGNPVIAHQVLTLLQKSGCRPAGPGEFSLRAVLHGKIDIMQAESIADLIDAQSPLGAAVALRNLKGGLEVALDPIRATVLSTLCEIEARLDFPDEDIGERHKAQLLSELRNALQQLSDLLKRSSQSSKLMRGYRVVLYGEPNAGKSTLLNALVGEERSIVHESPGTTRDVLEVNWHIDQMPVVLVDVAGIRESETLHPVEAMGIARAKKELERADLVLCLVDSTDAHAANLVLPENLPALKVFTKRDLLSAPRDGLTISAKTGEGMAELVSCIKEVVGVGLPDAGELVLTRIRHIELVGQAVDALTSAIASFADGVSDECVAYELRDAGRSLDELLGKNLNEEVLDLIFSRFCIGK
jgi:tRNA modification GTPase